MRCALMCLLIQESSSAIRKTKQIGDHTWPRHTQKGLCCVSWPAYCEVTSTMAKEGFTYLAYCVHEEQAQPNCFFTFLQGTVCAQAVQFRGLLDAVVPHKCHVWRRRSLLPGCGAHMSETMAQSAAGIPLAEVEDIKARLEAMYLNKPNSLSINQSAFVK